MIKNACAEVYKQRQEAKAIKRERLKKLDSQHTVRNDVAYG